MVNYTNTSSFSLYGGCLDRYGNRIDLGSTSYSQLYAFNPNADDKDSDAETQPLNSSGSQYDYGGDGPVDDKFALTNTTGDASAPSGVVEIYLDDQNGPQALDVDPESGGADDFDFVFPHGTFAENTKFSVSISAPDPITVDTTVDIDVTVTNNGGSGAKDVYLEANGNEIDTKSFSLNNSETVTKSYSYTPSSTGSKSLIADVDVRDSNSLVETDGVATVTADVQEPYYDVSITSTNSPVVEGDDLNVDVDISNTSDVDGGSQTIDLIADSTVVDSYTTTVSANSTDSTTFTWTTVDGDASITAVSVESDDDTASTSVTIQEPAYFTTTITSTNSPRIVGSVLDVDVDLENTGDVQDTKTIELVFDGVVEDSTDVTLSGGSTTSVTLSFTTVAGDGATNAVTAQSPDTADSVGVTIEDRFDGAIQLGDSGISGADVVVYDLTTSEFVGSDTTSADGGYEVVFGDTTNVAFGDTVAIAIDYDDGTDWFGRLVTTVV